MVIRSVQDFVTSMGGTGRCADWAGTTDATVSNWIARGYLPAGYHMRALLEIKRRNLKAAPEFFGVEGDEYVDMLSRLQSTGKAGNAPAAA